MSDTEKRVISCLLGPELVTGLTLEGIETCCSEYEVDDHDAYFGDRDVLKVLYMCLSSLSLRYIKGAGLTQDDETYQQIIDNLAALSGLPFDDPEPYLSPAALEELLVNQERIPCDISVDVSDENTVPSYMDNKDFQNVAWILLRVCENYDDNDMQKSRVKDRHNGYTHFLELAMETCRNIINTRHLFIRDYNIYPPPELIPIVFEKEREPEQTDGEPVNFYL